MRTMEALEALTVELKDLRGGEMLRRLRLMGGPGGGGDEASRQLHTFLLHQVRVRAPRSVSRSLCVLGVCPLCQSSCILCTLSRIP